MPLDASVYPVTALPPNLRPVRPASCRCPRRGDDAEAPPVRRRGRVRPDPSVARHRRGRRPPLGRRRSRRTRACTTPRSGRSTTPPRTPIRSTCTWSPSGCSTDRSSGRIQAGQRRALEHPLPRTAEAARAERGRPEGHSPDVPRRGDPDHRQVRPARRVRLALPHPLPRGPRHDAQVRHRADVLTLADRCEWAALLLPGYLGQETVGGRVRIEPVARNLGEDRLGRRSAGLIVEPLAKPVGDDRPDLGLGTRQAGRRRDALAARPRGGGRVRRGAPVPLRRSQPS